MSKVSSKRGTTSGLTDSQLLARFASRDGAGDDAAEAAFAALVDRHGGMVLRTCRRILDEDQAAQDAAQAAFLVLARRARSITRRDSVAAWLHGVAVRVAFETTAGRDPEADTGSPRRRASRFEPGEPPRGSLDLGCLVGFEEACKALIAGISAHDIAPK